MRTKLIVGFLGLALVTAAIFPLTRSDAARTKNNGAQALPNLQPVGPQGNPLPNFDIRLQGRGEFPDFDLTSPSGKERGLQNAAVRARVPAVDQFRGNARAEAAQNLRAIANEAGAMKHFFIDGASLSEPESDSADNIARRFLNRHASMFALTPGHIANLEKTKEDNDRGTVFLDYFQTHNGYKVFEGQVQVVVNKHGEVLSVREGFLVEGAHGKLKAKLSEARE